MYLVILFLVLSIISFIVWKHIDVYDYEVLNILSGATTIISSIVLVILLIIIPFSRTNDRDFALKIQSYRSSLINIRTMSEFERVQIAKDILDINSDLKQRQYWAHSNWYNWYYNVSILDTLKPLQ